MGTSTAEDEASAAGLFGVELYIQDDGRGFDLEDVPADRMGLGIMRERAQAIDADLEIESLQGEGTRVRVRWINSPPTEEGEDDA